jgi:hypothetical protein
MDQSPSWEANRLSASQEIPAFYGTRRFITALTRARQRISTGPRLYIVFRNMVILYGEELLAPRPTPKLEGHP